MVILCYATNIGYRNLAVIVAAFDKINHQPSDGSTSIQTPCSAVLNGHVHVSRNTRSRAMPSRCHCIEVRNCPLFPMLCGTGLPNVWPRSSLQSSSTFVSVAPGGAVAHFHVGDELPIELSVAVVQQMRKCPLAHDRLAPVRERRRVHQIDIAVEVVASDQATGKRRERREYLPRPCRCVVPAPTLFTLIHRFQSPDEIS